MSEALQVKEKPFFLPFRWLHPFEKKHPLDAALTVELKCGEQHVGLIFQKKNLQQQLLLKEAFLWANDYAVVAPYNLLSGITLPGELQPSHADRIEATIAASQRRYPKFHIPAYGELKMYERSSLVAGRRLALNRVRDLVRNDKGESWTLKNVGNTKFFKFEKLDQPKWQDFYDAVDSEIDFSAALISKDKESVAFKFNPTAEDTNIKLIDDHLIIWQALEPFDQMVPFPFGKYHLVCFEIKDCTNFTKEVLFNSNVEYIAGLVKISKVASAAESTEPSTINVQALIDPPEQSKAIEWKEKQ